MGKEQRAEKRRLKKGLNKRISISLQEYEKIKNMKHDLRIEYDRKLNALKDQLRQENLAQDVTMYCTLVDYILIKEYGFGKKRVENFNESFSQACVDVTKGKLEFKECMKLIKAKKIDFKRSYDYETNDTSKNN